MSYLVQAPQNPIQTTIQLPASKSISNRVLILNALQYNLEDVMVLNGRPYSIDNLINLSESDDTQVMLDVFKGLASEACKLDFDIKAAGTSMRFLTAFLSQEVGEWTITGTERMKNRPIQLLVNALRTLGAQIEYIEKEGYPPLRIKGGELKGGEISLSGGVSSQYISALLMVAPTTEQGVILHLEGNIISRPYINLTIQLMKQFGVEVQWQGNTLTVLPQRYKHISFTVESDWSAASYWYAITALSSGSTVTLPHLFKDSLQGDAAGATVFTKLGVNTTYTEDGVVLTHTGNRVDKLEYDFISEPDLAQTFVVVCTHLNIPFRFTGLQTLKIKETDRIEALKVELRKLGYVITDRQDSMLEWNGERCEPEADPVIHTYEDHRMAMAFAPVALVRKEGLKIAEPGVVSKSYPRFWEDLKKAGFSVKE